jgi:hypothetical protein
MRTVTTAAVDGGGSGEDDGGGGGMPQHRFRVEIIMSERTTERR